MQRIYTSPKILLINELNCLHLALYIGAYSASRNLITKKENLRFGIPTTSRLWISYFPHKLHIVSFTIKKKSSDFITSARLWTFLKLTEFSWVKFGHLTFSFCCFHFNWRVNHFNINENNRRKKLGAQISPNAANFKKSTASQKWWNHLISFLSWSSRYVVYGKNTKFTIGRS